MALIVRVCKYFGSGLSESGFSGFKDFSGLRSHKMGEGPRRNTQAKPRRYVHFRVPVDLVSKTLHTLEKGLDIEFSQIMWETLIKIRVICVIRDSDNLLRVVD